LSFPITKYVCISLIAINQWHVYRKWNEKFFLENYKAFKEGRAEKDPSEFWYQGEIGFFDFYIIPLAKKLKGRLRTYAECFAFAEKVPDV